jgi:hypothetical protein
MDEVAAIRNEPRAAERERIARENRPRSGMHVVDFLNTMRSDSGTSSHWGNSPHVPSMQSIVERTAVVMEARRRARHEAKNFSAVAGAGGVDPGAVMVGARHKSAPTFDPGQRSGMHVSNFLAEAGASSSSSSSSSTSSSFSFSDGLPSREEGLQYRPATAAERNYALDSIVRMIGGFNTDEGRAAIAVVTTDGVMLSQITQWLPASAVARNVAMAHILSKKGGFGTVVGRAAIKVVTTQGVLSSQLAEWTQEAPADDVDTPPDLIALADRASNEAPRAGGGISNHLSAPAPAPVHHEQQHPDYRLDPDDGADY